MATHFFGGIQISFWEIALNVFFARIDIQKAPHKVAPIFAGGKYLQDGAPEAYYFRGFIPSYPNLQPWFFTGFAGVITYNYLITREGPSCI